MRIIYLGLIVILLCGACAKSYDHQGRTPLVELDGNFLYREDLLQVLPIGLSSEDSLLFSEHYIRNWVENVLLYDKAQSNIPDGAEIDKLVGNYRKALVVHTYQQALIHQKLGNEITEEDLLDYYTKNQSAFQLDYPIIKGLFIKVPLQASGVNQVRSWYRSGTHEAVEQLEKYQMQHAVKYEYFYNKWMPITEVLEWMPTNNDITLETYLDKHRHVELKDTAFYYFLNVTEYRPSGEQEPYEFARLQVKNMLLNMKQVKFMKQVKNDLYDRAVKKNMIKYY